MTRAATVTPDWLRERGYTADLRTGRAVRLTPSQGGDATVSGRCPDPASVASAGPRDRTARPAYRSKLEAAYAVVLDARLRAGEVAAWYFEAVSLRLGHDLMYVPDFLVDTAEGRLEFHEVKGVKKGPAWERSRVKLYAAAHQFPMFTFVLITRDQSGWRFENVRA